MNCQTLPLFELAHITGGVQLSLDDVHQNAPELVVVIPCSGDKAPGLYTAAGTPPAAIDDYRRYLSAGGRADWTTWWARYRGDY